MGTLLSVNFFSIAIYSKCFIVLLQDKAVKGISMEKGFLLTIFLVLLSLFGVAGISAEYELSWQKHGKFSQEALDSPKFSCPGCIVEPGSYLFCQVNATNKLQILSVYTSNSSVLAVASQTLVNVNSTLWLVTLSSLLPGRADVSVWDGAATNGVTNCEGLITVIPSVSCDQNATYSIFYGNNCPSGSVADSFTTCRCKSSVCQQGLCFTVSANCELPLVTAPNTLLQCYPSNSIVLLSVNRSSSLIGNGADTSILSITTLSQASVYGSLLSFQGFLLCQIGNWNIQSSTAISFNNVYELRITDQLTIAAPAILSGNLYLLTLYPNSRMIVSSTASLSSSLFTVNRNSQLQLTTGSKVTTSAFTSLYGSLSLESGSFANFSQFVYLNSTCQGSGVFLLSGAALITEGRDTTRTCGIELGRPFTVASSTASSRKFAVQQSTQSSWTPCGNWSGPVLVRSGQRVNFNLNCSSAVGGPAGLSNQLLLEQYAILNFDNVYIAGNGSSAKRIYIRSIQMLGPVFLTFSPPAIVSFSIAVAGYQVASNTSIIVTTCFLSCRCSVNFQKGLMFISQDCSPPKGPSDAWIVGAIVGGITVVLIFFFIWCARRCTAINLFNRPTKREIPKDGIPDALLPLFPPTRGHRPVPPAVNPQLNSPFRPMQQQQSGQQKGNASVKAQENQSSYVPTSTSDDAELPDPFMCSSVMFDGTTTDQPR